LGDRANLSACFISFPIDIPSSELGDDLSRHVPGPGADER